MQYVVSHQQLIKNIFLKNKSFPIAILPLLLLAVTVPCSAGHLQLFLCIIKFVSMLVLAWKQVNLLILKLRLSPIHTSPLLPFSLTLIVSLATVQDSLLRRR